jgi:hypothetical protein
MGENKGFKKIMKNKNNHEKLNIFVFFSLFVLIFAIKIHVFEQVFSAFRSAKHKRRRMLAIYSAIEVFQLIFFVCVGAIIVVVIVVAQMMRC